MIDDAITADRAFRLACEGTALLWRGDFHNGKQLLRALGRRFDKGLERRQRRGGKNVQEASSPGDAFHRYRQRQAQRARILGALLIPVEEDYRVSLRRAPDLRRACEQAWGPSTDGDTEGGSSGFLVSLSELLGIVGAFEWRRRGVAISALGEPPDNRIHPHYGVFSPVRGEYIDLVSEAPLPGIDGQDLTAFDIGTGTGVLAALLARRGVERVIATDLDPRALACARDNLVRLGCSATVQVVEGDLFPVGRADVVVCNPPWLPGRPVTSIERAVYDQDSGMLRGFLAGLSRHLTPGGEGWLILSDLAEHLGLRTRQELLGAIQRSGLQVVGRSEARPKHPKASDAQDPLHAARAAEVTSLWRLRIGSTTG